MVPRAGKIEEIEPIAGGFKKPLLVSVLSGVSRSELGTSVYLLMASGCTSCQ